MIRAFAVAAACLVVLGAGDPVPKREDPPATAREWYERARELTRTQKRQQAVDAFDRSVALDPERAMVWANRGTNLLNMGRYEAALESYERALALDPRDPYIYCSRATVFNRTEQPDKALESSQEAIEVDPEHVGALFSMATALRQLGRDDEADAAIERAFKMRPELVARQGSELLLDSRPRRRHHLVHSQAPRRRARRSRFHPAGRALSLGVREHRAGAADPGCARCAESSARPAVATLRESRCLLRRAYVVVADGSAILRRHLGAALVLRSRAVDRFLAQ